MGIVIDRQLLNIRQAYVLLLVQAGCQPVPSLTHMVWLVTDDAVQSSALQERDCLLLGCGTSLARPWQIACCQSEHCLGDFCKAGVVFNASRQKKIGLPVAFSSVNGEDIVALKNGGFVIGRLVLNATDQVYFWLFASAINRSVGYWYFKRFVFRKHSSWHPFNCRFIILLHSAAKCERVKAEGLLTVVQANDIVNAHFYIYCGRYSMVENASFPLIIKFWISPHFGDLKPCTINHFRTVFCNSICFFCLGNSGPCGNKVPAYQGHTNNTQNQREPRQKQGFVGQVDQIVSRFRHALLRGQVLLRQIKSAQLIRIAPAA